MPHLRKHLSHLGLQFTLLGTAAFALAGFLSPGADAAQPATPPTETAAESTPALSVWIDDVRHLGIGESMTLPDIAMPRGEPVNLGLTRFQVLTDDATVIVSGAKGDRPLDLSDVVLLRGKVVGDEGSRVFIAFSDSGANGFIEGADGLYSLSTGPAGPVEPGDLRITKIEGPLAGEHQPQAVCGVGPDAPHLHPGEDLLPIGIDELEAYARTVWPCQREAKIAIDTDWEYTSIRFGGDATASAAYALSLMGAVSEIFSSNLNIHLSVSYLRVWDSNNDPYNDWQDPLQQFRSHWNAAQGDVERHTAHFLTARTDMSYGGIAYVNALCDREQAYGVSGNINGSFPYPLINNHSGNWDPVVVAHELGHNFGTRHTHDGYSPPIDNCGNSDCTDAQHGTIMSYCHTCSGGLTNITLNFHPLVRARILQFLDSISCDLTMEVVTKVQDDAVGTVKDTPITIDALLNDLNASCGPVFIADFDESTAHGGTVEMLGPDDAIERQRFLYTPPQGFEGTDTFSYTAVGGETATVTIQVLALRDPDAPGFTQSGVAVDYYSLNDPVNLPDYDQLHPYASDAYIGIFFPSTDGEFASSGRSENVGAVFEGFITVPEDGLYTFFTESSDGSRLYIGDRLVVDNDGQHTMREQEGPAALRAGPHRIRVEFFSMTGEAGLIARFRGPLISKRLIEPRRWSRSLPCPGDVTADGLVDLADLNLVLANFGQTTGSGDANGDGDVDLTDLNLVLSAFGDSCL